MYIHTYTLTHIFTYIIVWYKRHFRSQGIHLCMCIFVHIHTYIQNHDLQEALQSICKSWGIHDSEFFASMQLLKPYNPDKGGVHLHTTSKMDILKLQVT